jgi:hypothetical protein
MRAAKHEVSVKSCPSEKAARRPAPVNFTKTNYALGKRPLAA